MLNPIKGFLNKEVLRHAPLCCLLITLVGSPENHKPHVRSNQVFGFPWGPSPALDSSPTRLHPCKAPKPPQVEQDDYSEALRDYLASHLVHDK